MAQDPVSASKDIITSDYSIDKIVFRREVTYQVTNGPPNDSGLRTFTIPHGLPFKPMMFGTYSDDNFTTSYELGTGPFWYNVSFAMYTNRISAMAYSDATNIYINANNTDTTKNFTFRLLAFPPPDYEDSGSLPALTPTSGKRFSSDLNYLKLFKQGSASISTSGAFGFETLSIPHDLGYIPYVLMWTEIDGFMYPSGNTGFVGYTGINTRISADTTIAYLDYDPFATTTFKLHYKVYLDD